MPENKIFDIRPPEKTKKLPVFPRPPQKPVFLKKPVVPIEKVTPQKPSSFLKKGPILIVVALILVGALGYFSIKPKAEIEVWPKTQSSDFKAQLVVLIDIEESDFSSSQIPGEIINAENIVSREFFSTGTKSKSIKAQGTIRVYNAHSTTPLTLVAITRFVSDDGKLFRTPKRITIPGGSYEGGKLVPGSIDIMVEADQSGEEYNIGPSTFSIPGFAGTARYTAFYARSFEPMTGGMKTETPQVTQEDLDNAQAILTKEALEESKIALENSLPSQDYMIVEETITEEITKITPLAEEGQEIDKFLFQVKAKAEAIVFKKSDLENFAKAYILTQIPQEKKLVEGSLGIGFLPQTFDLEQGKIILDLEISAEIYRALDEEFLKGKITNKRPDEVKTALREISEIDKAQTRLWPFWATKTPENSDRINIKLKLD